MIFYSSQMLFYMEMLVFASVIFMHLSKKNYNVAILYVAQSFVIGVMLLNAGLRDASFMFMIAIAVILIVKIIIAPYFFYKLIKKHHLKFSVSTYLNSPMTLIVLAFLTGFAFSDLFSPLAVLSAQNIKAILLAAATILTSVFLIINRRGAMSQMIGILSLENAIVSFACLAGLEETPALQLGIIFDILVWLMIASIFTSMVYNKFGSLNVTAMKELKEE